MENLLKKTRRLNKTLQSYASNQVSFSDLSKILSDILEANVYIASKKGKILGFALSEDFECDTLNTEIVKDRRFPKKYNNELLRITETSENIKGVTDCVFDHNSECNCSDKVSTVIPINSRGNRLGTLVITRFGKEFNVSDLILCEYSATVVGMEILKSKTEELEEEDRKKAIVKMAIDTLSYSEEEAMTHIFRELDGMQGVLVASKIADKVGITRSVIVNALRKLESAGVIESRSLGMKGTFIKILNEKLIDELESKQ